MRLAGESLVLPLFHGHPDKRFNIAIRGEGHDEEGRGEAAAQAVQRGVQAAGAASDSEGRRVGGGARPGLAASADLRVAWLGAAARPGRGSAAADAVGARTTQA